MHNSKATLEAHVKVSCIYRQVAMYVHAPCCAVLHSAMLCYAVLCYAVLCCSMAMLCYAMLCCAVLCCAVLCCAVLRCAVVCYMLSCALLCCVHNVKASSQPLHHSPCRRSHSTFFSMDLLPMELWFL